MTSRRPMTRSYSGNGRTSSFGEEEGSSSNRESRNTYLSNVRPENRSTLCSVMAQLTEDTQPSFETTLKSKAVSENCNVKFNCVVTGSPAPELTWYKDDMEMDRYCGLPKYEIHRNGKNHSLQIYNCTLDDAAIYQASASNSKGIVSCSGVLEVGTMSEYLIHQRFFAKLKQKADNKRKELEDSKKRGKEDVQREPSEGSPQRAHRKRPGAPPAPPAEEPHAAEQSGPAASQPNGAGAEMEETAPQTPAGVAVEKVEDSEPSSKESVATKKMKISNGVDGVSGGGGGRGRTIANGRQNSYDGGLSLAQFLAETVSSQAVEEKQAEKTCETDTSVQGLKGKRDEDSEREAKCKEVKESEKVNVLVQEHERLKASQVELPVEKEKDRERQMELHRAVSHPPHSAATKGHRRGHKDHDHHNIQASISSVLHTVKDFFFGKGKKDSPDHRDKEEEEDHDPVTHGRPSPPQTPPPPRREEHGARPEDVVPVKSDESREPSRVVATEPRSGLGEPLTTRGGEQEVTQKEHLTAPPPPSDSGMDPVEPGVKEAAMSWQVDHRRPGEAAAVAEALELVEEKEKHPPQKISATEETASTQNMAAATLPAPTVERQMSPARALSSSPQTQAPACGEASSPAAPGFSTPVGVPLPSVTVETDRCGLEEAPAETPGDKRHQAGAAAETCPSEPPPYSQAASHPPVSQGAVEQPELLECVAQMEADLPALEEQMVVDSACIDPVPIPIITIQADDTMVSDSMEMEYTPLIQTMNTEDLPSVSTVDSAEIGDLRMQLGGAPDVFESAQGCHLTVSTTSALEQNEDIVPLQEGLTSAFKKKKEVHSNQKLEEQGPSEIESTEKTRETSWGNKGLTLTVESESDRGKEGKAFAEVQDDLSESLSLPGARNEEVTARLSEDAIVVANPDSGSCLFMENVPESETSNSTEIKAIIPQIAPSIKIIKTGNDAKEPEVREPTLPCITLTPVTKPHSLQKDLNADMSKVILIDTTIPVSKAHSVSPSETRILNEDQKPPTDKTQEVVQLHDRTDIQHAEPHISEHTTQVPLVSIPAIRFSYTDENKVDVDVPVCDAETAPVSNAQVNEAPKVPLLVVPPISIVCDDSPVEAVSVSPPHTVAGPPRGGEAHLGGLTTLESPRQDRLLNGAPTPANMPTSALSLDPRTDAAGDAVTRRTKPTRVVDREPDAPGAEPDAPGSEPARGRQLQADRLPVERLDVKAHPTHAALSPASLRRFLSRAAAPRSDSPTAMAVPAITVGDSQGDRTGEELSGGSTPTSSLSCESSPRLKRRDSQSLIRSATPEELASGARRKIFMPRAKGEDGGEAAGVPGAPGVPEVAVKRETPPYMSPSQARRAALLQAPAVQNTPPMERRSPLLNRRKATLEVPRVVEEKPAEQPGSGTPEDRPAEKEKADPFKAPQVIRKIRGEPFPDASGHLKLWCQFFNILSDSTIKWYRDEEEILELKRSGGDESQVALAIVQASSPDCGVYGCTIRNEHGTDTTDFLLSVDILSDMLLKEDLEVGEEIEMTPLRFTKGLADVSCWGDKFFGRIMTKESHMGEGSAHKACRIKVIYGLDPVFESGSTCIMKVQSPIPYGTKEERNLAEKNLEMTKQECKIQNMIREYCKIFAAEARVIENFGVSLEVIPQYLMYRPANSVPYATVETDLPGVFLKYCLMDAKGRLILRTISEVEQKCCTFQHWIHQWTHGNLLVTHLQGVETKLTNIRVVTKSKGYQGLTEQGSPQVLEQFAAQHQCNYFCGLLGLRSLKAADNQQQSSKIKGSRSPLLNRKLSTSSSPQLQRKGVPSPQTSRKATSSPKVARKALVTEEKNQTAKANHEGTSEVVLKS